MRGDKKVAVDRTFGAWGHFMVSFSGIGAGLYIVSQVFDVDFERFLGMVFLGGAALLAMRPDFNPNFSQAIEHDLTAAQLETIELFYREKLKLERSKPGKERARIVKNMQRTAAAGY